MSLRTKERRVAPVMPASTGSVYLDAPRPSRYRTLPRKRAHGSRTIAATVLGTVGLLGLTALALLIGIRALVAEPAPVAGAIGTALDEPTAQAELELEIADAIEHDLIGDDIAIAVTAFGIDVRTEAERIATAVLDDEGFRAALDDLVVDLHRRIVVEADPSPVDLVPISAAVRAVIEAESPVLSGVMPADTTLMTIETDSLPDLTGPMGLVDRSVMLAALLALAIPLAALVHPRRHQVMSWTGRWLLAAGLTAAVLAVGLPYLGGKYTGWSTVEAAVRSSSLRLLAPAAIAGIVGMGLVSVASVAKNRERRRVADEGAAAALGVDEPPLLGAPISAELDIAQRGLVDADRTLTNV